MVTRGPGIDMDVIRRFFITQLVLISMAFLCYLTFPVQTDLLLNEKTGEHEYGESIAGRLCYKLSIRVSHCLWLVQACTRPIPSLPLLHSPMIVSRVRPG